MVWRNLASETQRTFGFLGLDPLKLQDLSNCSAADLHEAVIRTRVLEESWLKGYAKPVKTSKLDTIMFEKPSTPKSERQTLYFISDWFIVTASVGCLIEAFNLRTQMTTKSNYCVSGDSKGTVLSPSFALEDTSLYFAEYQNHDSDADDIPR